MCGKKCTRDDILWKEICIELSKGKKKTQHTYRYTHTKPNQIWAAGLKLKNNFAKNAGNVVERSLI